MAALRLERSHPSGPTVMVAALAAVDRKAKKTRSSFGIIPIYISTRFDDVIQGCNLQTTMKYAIASSNRQDLGIH
jgi:hypothetical protein